MGKSETYGIRIVHKYIYLQDQYVTPLTCRIKITMQKSKSRGPKLVHVKLQDQNMTPYNYRTKMGEIKGREALGWGSNNKTFIR